MIIDVFNFLVGFSCVFFALIILFSKQIDSKINLYFTVILFNAGQQRLFHALKTLGITSFTYNPFQKNPLLFYFIVPLFYLFFLRVVNDKTRLKKELLHFILPAALVLLNFLYVDYKFNRLLFIPYSVVYFVLIFLLMKNFYFNKKLTLLEVSTNTSKKKWLIIMVILTISLFVHANYYAINNDYHKSTLTIYYGYTSILWFLVVLHLLRNPILIFGKQVLFKNIRLNQTQDFNIWSSDPLKLIEQKDDKVRKSIADKVDIIILEICSLQVSVSLISKQTLDIKTLGNELRLPKQHLAYVFKYYCNYSVNDYSNLVKIKYALTLINDGFLENFTVEALGEKCLFKSRFTFSTNFKKFVGVSVTDFTSSQVQIIKNDLTQTQNG
jgi:AraC-like DNA-binding protein